jgi:hypothetical protein
MYLLAGLLWYAFWLTVLLAVVEAVLVVTDPAGRRLGDKQAGTQVVYAAA